MSRSFWVNSKILQKQSKRPKLITNFIDFLWFDWLCNVIDLRNWPCNGSFSSFVARPSRFQILNRASTDTSLDFEMMPVKAHNVFMPVWSMLKCFYFWRSNLPFFLFILVENTYALYLKRKFAYRQLLISLPPLALVVRSLLTSLIIIHILSFLVLDLITLFLEVTIFIFSWAK